MATPSLADPPDLDADGIFDGEDNCLDRANPSQTDTDVDGYGNACDADYDNNGTVNTVDFSVFKSVYLTGTASGAWCDNVGPVVDFNDDGIINVIDLSYFKGFYLHPVGNSGLACAGGHPCAVDDDLDNDGAPNSLDNCIRDSNSGIDADSDGYGNRCDGDLDNDGVMTAADDAFFTCAFRTGNQAADIDEDGLLSSSLDTSAFKALKERCTPGLSGQIENPLPKPPPGPSLVDGDGDKKVAYLDNCTADPNPGQSNSDYDLFGNACDADYNNDGIVNESDQSILNSVMGLKASNPGFNPEVDFDDNLEIDAADADFLSKRFLTAPGPSGLPCPPLPPANWAPAAFDDYLYVFQGGVLSAELAAVDYNEDPIDREITSPPSHGQVVITDPATGAFTYTPNPGTNALSDAFEFTASDGALTSPPARVNISIWDTQGSSFTAAELPARTLVLYNLNFPGADELASYYAERRGIGASRQCAVRMPSGLYASRDQMLSLRKQVVEGCICPLIPENDRPVPCTAGPALAEHSPITHLVLMKGLPGRMHDTGWISDAEEPSLDFFLSYLIYSDTDLFGCPTCSQSNGAADSNPYGKQVAPLKLAGTYLREMNPARDRFLAYSRIEAMTLDRTKDLIDRTLAAEARGFRGNVLTEKTGGEFPRYHFDFTRRLTGTFGSVEQTCEEYITHDFVFMDPASMWDPLECRAGTTYTEDDCDTPNEVNCARSGLLPGDRSAPQSTIPTVVDAGFLFGGFTADVPLTINGQAGFNHVGTLEAWHKTELECTALCSQLPGGECPPEDPEHPEFRDYFGKLNPACVGVGPGFVGYQTRSFPVQYYGFFPAGWGNGDTGTQEKTPPEQRTGGAFAGSRYLHLGARSVGAPDASTCPRLDGSQEPCKEQIVLRLETNFVLSPPLTVSDTRRFEVRLRHRNPANPVGRLQVWLTFWDGQNSYVRKDQFSLLDERLSWHEPAPISFNAVAAETPEIDQIRLTLDIEFSDQVFGALDLDGIELIDTEAPGVPLLEDARGGFEAEPGSVTHPGDYAANAIDRLGAIAWFGSSSHFMTQGHSFDEGNQVMQSFFAGRTLAESVQAGGGGQAGLIYGDPLYRPSAAVLFIPSEPRTRPTLFYENRGAQTPAGTPLVVTSENLARTRFLFMNVLHGTDHLEGVVQGVQWSISTCPDLDPVICTRQSLWSSAPVMEGHDSVKERPFDWTQFIDTGVDQHVTFRLKVWNTGEESSALYDFASFDYRAPPAP